MRPKFSGIRRGAANPLVLGRKFCGHCGRWRHACDYPMMTRARLDAYCQACNRIRSRAYYRASRPEQHADRREYVRIYREARRRIDGRPRRPPRGARVVDRVERVLLDAEPMREQLVAYRERVLLGLAEDEWRYLAAAGEVNVWKALAERAGVDERTVRRYVTGESKHVRLDCADRIALALGIPLAVIYPQEDAA